MASSTYTGSTQGRLRTLATSLRGKRARNIVGIGVCTLIVAVGAVMVAGPVVWMLSTSLKTFGEVFVIPPHWIPNRLVWENYPNALRFMKASVVYKNSAVITITCLLGETVVSSLVAFGFSRVRAPGRDTLFLLMLSTMMLPGQVTLIPQFILFKFWGWIDTFKPLIVPSFFGAAFFIFLMRQFYMTISSEMDEAARIDGCGYFGIYWRVILPLSKPVLGVVAIQSFMAHWNEFMLPLIFLNTRSKYTAAIALRLMTDDYGSTPWNELMAASLVMLLPCIALFFIAQRYFVEGIVFTGVKG